MTAATRKTCRVILLRHGSTPSTGKILPGRASGLHLSEAGREQAASVAEALAHERIDAVYTSPLERARETAAAVARGRGLRVRVRSGLIECDFGEWTGRQLSALRRLKPWATIQTQPSVFRFPGGESFVEMQRRIVDEIDTLAAQHGGETIVLASHADPIKAALCHASGAHLDHFQRFLIGPCSRSILWVGAGPPTVEVVNVAPPRAAQRGAA